MLLAAAARGVAPAPSHRLSGSTRTRRVVSREILIVAGARRGDRARVFADAKTSSSSAAPKRAAKNPEDWGGDYDKIRETLMSRHGWADSLPGISNSLNWLSENTFGAGKELRDGVDVLAGWYRLFLDALPYRRQDGRKARALPRGRAASAYARWEAFKAGKAARSDARYDASPVVGGLARALDDETKVLAYWQAVSDEAQDDIDEGKKRKQVNGVGLVVTNGKYVMTEGQIRALTSDVMGLVLALRRAAAADAEVERKVERNSSPENPAEIDQSADEAEDRREELLSGWGGGGNSIASSGGYGAITPGEAFEALDSVTAAPDVLSRRVKELSGLLLCTPGEAVAVAHRFPAILETPRSTLAARMSLLKELLPNADAAVIFRAEPRALLAGDGDLIMRDARAKIALIHTELPGVSADKLVEIEPRMLFEDISQGLAALKELWPEEAFRSSEEQNPFFAEELALAIKALMGKGAETPRMR